MGSAMSESFSGADLFGMAVSPTKRTNDRPEAAALCEVLMALKAHPAVSWCERMNSGAARVGGRFIRFGFTGCPDVLGQLRDGRLLGVEVKAPKGKLRPEQAVMLQRIAGAGGVAFVARDCRDVHRELEITYSIGGAK
ncbi:MAG: nuclease [Rhodoferax ferrireducens]|uniref:Nuclease n=1 Tax=Rhodoferax ferrireducens TaxID=192843 RepID=A0A1W9KNU9_9BURK|nr:MAG: nuclease [Rhodoferax ferrireducens]